MTCDEFSVADADWFRQAETQAVFACFNTQGFEVRAVGGAIRNTLLGYPVKEVDFATTAQPQEVLRLAQDAGIKTAPTGIDHGTITLVINKIPHEVTTLRRDISTDGRRATVAFGSDWAEDAKRRDFTVNALFADAKGLIHDPLGGLADIKAHRIRFIGVAQDRLREDYLRILRFVRFSAEYTRGPFDADGVLACIRERDGIERLSRERIRAELLRILVTRRAGDACEVLEDTGLMQRILAGVSYRARFQRLVRLEQALGLTPDPVLRLGALGVAVGEDACRLSARLRLSTSETTDLKGLAANMPAFRAGLSKDHIDPWLYRMGARAFRLALLLVWADHGIAADDADWLFALQTSHDWKKPRFPLSGNDLIGLGFQPGQDLGLKLKDLEDRWVKSKFLLPKEQLIKAAKGE